MGLAASQGRLLTLTARLSDIEFSTLQDSNAKQRLAVQSEEASNKYTKALNKQVLKFTTTATSNTSSTTVNLTAAVLSNCGLNGSVDAQRLLFTSNSNQVIVSSNVASAYETADGNKDVFLSQFSGTEVTKKYPSNSSEEQYNADAAIATAWKSKAATDDTVLKAFTDANSTATKTYAVPDKSLVSAANINSLIEAFSYMLPSSSSKNAADITSLAGGDTNNESIREAWNGIDNTSNSNGTYSSSASTSFQSAFNNIFTALTSIQTGLTGTGATTDSAALAKTIATILNAVPKDSNTGAIDYSSANISAFQTVLSGVSAIMNKDGRTNTSLSGAAQSLLDSAYVTSDTNFNWAYASDASKYSFDSATSTTANTTATSEAPTISYGTNYKYYSNLFDEMQKNGYLSEATSIMSSADWLNTQLTNGNVYIKEFMGDNYATTNGTDSNFKEEAWDSGDNQITEAEDTKAVTLAQAEYNSEMAKINSKDKLLDTDMKQLDTQHQAIQTEYDSVKQVIQKNIERSFKVFNG
ncbi:hypothetical protein KBA27_01385 [bacterium]|nr:hypothetical protein [bacterium]